MAAIPPVRGWSVRLVARALSKWYDRRDRFPWQKRLGVVAVDKGGSGEPREAAIGSRGVALRAMIEDALRSNWKSLFSYALRLTDNPDAAADLVQSCALKALGNRGAQPRPEAVRAWLFTIVRNSWIDSYRRDHHRDEEADTGSAPNGFDHRYDDGIIAEITVRQALRQIAPTHREIIELVDLAGFRYGEVASILGVPQGTIMSRLSRARQALLAVIERENLRPIESRRRHAQ